MKNFAIEEEVSQHSPTVYGLKKNLLVLLLVVSGVIFTEKKSNADLLSTSLELTMVIPKITVSLILNAAVIAGLHDVACFLSPAFKKRVGRYTGASLLVASSAFVRNGIVSQCVIGACRALEESLDRLEVRNSVSRLTTRLFQYPREILTQDEVWQTAALETAIARDGAIQVATTGFGDVDHAIRGMSQQSLDAWLEMAIQGLGTRIHREVASATRGSQRMLAKYLALGLGTAVGINLGLTLISSYIDHKAKQYRRPKLVEKPTQKSWFSLFGSGKNQGPKWSELVLNHNIKKKILRYVKLLKLAKKNRFRKSLLPSMMLYGPPGTGKTELAKRIAKELDWNFLVVPAGNFNQFSMEEGIREINSLFAWAESNSGTIIFVDEADVFLQDRGKGSACESTKNFLASWLAHTSSLSSRYTVIYATNKREILDDAILRRVTYQIEMSLPDDKMRRDLAKLYFDKYRKKFPHIRVDVESNHIFEYASSRLSGLSAAHIEEGMTRLFLEAGVEGSSIDKKLYLQVMDDVAKKM